MTLLRKYDIPKDKEDNSKTKRVAIVNGCIRCTVFKDASLKSMLDAIYDEHDIPTKVKLLRVLHDISSTEIKEYIMKISLMIYYLDDEKQFIKTFNKIEEMFDMPAAIIIECKLNK